MKRAVLPENSKSGEMARLLNGYAPLNYVNRLGCVNTGQELSLSLQNLNLWRLDWLNKEIGLLHGK